MNILGINSAYHESAAALLNGHTVVAVEEERLTGTKHAKEASPYGAWLLPFEAIGYCLAAADLVLTEVDHIAYSYDPRLHLRKSWASIARSLLTGRWVEAQRDCTRLYCNHRVPQLLTEGAPKRQSLRRLFLTTRRAKWEFHFVAHHLAHAASAFLPSPFESAAIMTADGIGEDVCTFLAVGQGTEIAELKSISYPNSLGLYYEEVTKFLGFQRNNDECKVMALAAHGEPRYLHALRNVVTLTDNGGYRVGMDFRHAGEFGAPELQRVLGPSRPWGGAITRRHRDIAASSQAVLEATVLHILRWLHKASGCDNLCLAGGVFLNCVLNERIQHELPFKRIFVQPAAHDAGTALGAAMYVRHVLLREPRTYVMEHAYLGPSFEKAAIEQRLQECKVPYRFSRDVASEVASLLAIGKLVGWFQGRMEWGPRALGNRSILADPRNASMKEELNRLKNRDHFQPFAPAILAEAASDYFECGESSPFMMFARRVRSSVASQIPAVVHVDGTARVQTVHADTNPQFHHLIETFRQQTGVPLVLNTSLNRPGKPIVCTVEQALDCFFNTGLDVLAIGDLIIEKRGR